MTDNPDAYVRAIEAHIHGWRSATFGWQGDPDPKVEWANRQRAIQKHAAECLRRIAAEMHAAGVPVAQAPSDDDIAAFEAQLRREYGHAAEMMLERDFSGDYTAMLTPIRLHYWLAGAAHARGVEGREPMADKLARINAEPLSPEASAAMTEMFETPTSGVSVDHQQTFSRQVPMEGGEG